MDPMKSSVTVQELGGDKIFVSVTLLDAIRLPWGPKLNSFEILVAEEGVLMAKLGLSVSPDSPEHAR